MISIIVVYNNKQILNEILLESLKNQTIKFELIAIDNTNGQFKSATEALNYGGKKAKGKYIMFIHQDVELNNHLWLENTERLLDDIHDLGIAGVSGMSEEGKNSIERRRGYISDCGEFWGKPLKKTEVVQTLDELLLIVPKSVFDKLQFDEKTFSGWHCYGSDFCLSVRKMGLKAYVIPAFVYHRSFRSNIKGLLKYQKRLYSKHREKFKHIYTTTGEICWKSLKSRTYVDFLKLPYKKLFPGWIEYLKNELSTCNTVLDLGCGCNSPIRSCDLFFSVGVELFGPYLHESKKKRIHNQYIKADIRKIEFNPDSFDSVIAIEVLEHLTKQEGYELLGKMVMWAKKKVIVTTPNGYLEQNAFDNNPLQEHKSEWNSIELKNMGFKVHGMNGWRKLRGYKGLVRYKPPFLWARISDLTQKMTYYYPSLAFQLFAVKELDKCEKGLTIPKSQL